MSRIYFTPSPEKTVVTTWIRRVIDRIIQWIDLPRAQIFIFEELNEEPDKPETGMLVLADGTDWNPGSGSGIYYYTGATWTKL